MRIRMLLLGALAALSASLPAQQVDGPGAVRINPLDPAERSSWIPSRGEWKFDGASLTGSGNSSISYTRVFVPPVRVSFDIEVKSGNRPRVYFDKNWFGQEGFNGHHFGLYPDLGKPKRVDFKTGQTYAVQVDITKDQIELRVAGKLLETRVKPFGVLPPIRFSSGDDYSKGTTRFSNLVILNVPPKPASGEAGAPRATAATTNPPSALVIIRGKQSAGSGFIARFDGKLYLFTNNHVAAGLQQPQFTLLDGTRLSVLATESAVGHDIMRFTLKDPPPDFLETSVDVERNAHLDEDVQVLGNSGGGGVVTRIAGKILGLGPDRIEVSAPFIPGNSGSPIIQASTGRVLGIATYLSRREESLAGKPGTGIRRFGYRLDSVKTWEPVDWKAFQLEAERLAKITALTEDIHSFLEALEKKRTPSFATDALRRPAEEWRQTISRRRLSEADRKTATQSFLSTLRNLTRSDVAAFETSVHYNFFREKLKQERTERDALYESFNKQIERLSTPMMQGR